jgi:hypothetical protein
LVAVVILSPEEAEIALSGALWEPRYRPFQGSARGRKLEEWEEVRRLAAALSGKGDSVAFADSGTDLSPGPLASQRLPRIGAAHRWKRSAYEQTLLVARRDDRFQIIALGTVEGSSRAPIEGVRRLEIRVRHVLRQSIPLDEVRTGLDARQQALLDERLAGELRPLSPKLGLNVMTVLTERAPDLALPHMVSGRRLGPGSRV